MSNDKVIRPRAPGASVEVQDYDGVVVATFQPTGMVVPGSFSLDEQATVPGGAPPAGKGVLWVRNDAPNVVVYTDDAGTDHELISSGGGALLQIATKEESTVATGTAAAANDDTIPQTSEGDEFLTFDAFTPTDAASKIRAQGVMCCAYASGGHFGWIFVTRDAGTEAIKAHSFVTPGANITFEIPFDFLLDADDALARTYRIFVGATAANTMTRNGVSGSRKGGGAQTCFGSIQEFA